MNIVPHFECVTMLISLSTSPLLKDPVIGNFSFTHQLVMRCFLATSLQHVRAALSLLQRRIKEEMLHKERDKVNKQA